MPIDLSQVQWDEPSAPKPIGAPQPLTFAEKYVAPLLESVVGSNPQGSPTGRFIQGAADPMLGLTQMAAHAIPGAGAAYDQKISDLEKQYQGQRAIAGSTGIDPLRIAGNVSSFALAPAATAEASGPLYARMLRAGLSGGAYGLAQPVTQGDYAAEKGKQGIGGAMFSAAGVPLSSTLARVVRPSTGENQKALIESGINLTPGQTLGGGFQRAEDAMTSWPVVGDFIRDAKNRTLTDMSRATYARAIDPVNPVRKSLGLPTIDVASLPAGPDGVLAVKNALGESYDALLPKLKFDVRSVAPQLTQLRGMAATLPDQEAKQFNAILDKNLSQLSNGVADGQTFKTITSNLGSESKSFMGSTDAYQRKLGDALSQAQAIFRDGLKASNPQFADQLAAIDQGYGNYAVIRRAAASAGDKSHGFTPAQLAAAVRGQDTTVGKGATATGTARMQDLSDAARAVLPPTVSDSGTPFRHAIQLLGGSVLAGAAGHSFIPEGATSLIAPAVAGGALMTLPYTSLGQKAAQAVLADRPDWAPALAAALRRAGPVAGAVGGAAAVPALTNGS